MARVALVYDADNTLMKGYHPSLILEKRGLDPKIFWNKVTSSQKIEEERGEKTRLDIIYLAQFMNEVRNGNLKGLTKAEMKEAGKDLPKMFYPGLPEFFTKIKEANPSHEISHNIVSVGIKDLLQSSVLGHHMKHIFGYTFFDNFTPGPQIDEIKSTTSSVEKVDSIVQISKGNAPGIYEYPIQNMIYFGDGQTDIPAFKFVKQRHGTTILVYDPNTPGAKEKAIELKRYVDYIVPADFTEGSELWNAVNETIKGSHENIVRKKTWPHLFERVLKGEKTAELRLADFEINEGDILILEEWDPETKQYTGRSLQKRVRNLNKVNLKDFHNAEEILNNDYWIIDLA